MASKIVLMKGSTKKAMQDLQERLAQTEQRLRESVQTEHDLRRQVTQLSEENMHLQQQMEKQKSSSELEFWNVPRTDIRIVSEIGRGGWGTIFEGTFQGRAVAVKQLHHRILSRDNTQRLRREVRIMAQVRHPNLLLFIAAVFDDEVERLRSPPLIVMELLDTDLRNAYERDLVDAQSKLSIFRDVAFALNYLHNCREPIIHRDLSAPNVLLEALANNRWKAKVSDFGSANLAKIAQTAAEGAIIYSAPETLPDELRGPNPPKVPQTPKIDVYSYGVLLCEVITCKLPDKFKQLKAEVQQSWPFMHSLITSCTNYYPDDRPTIDHILTDLQKAPIPEMADIADSFNSGTSHEHNRGHHSSQNRQNPQNVLNTDSSTPLQGSQYRGRKVVLQASPTPHPRERPIAKMSEVPTGHSSSPRFMRSVSDASHNRGSSAQTQHSTQYKHWPHVAATRHLGGEGDEPHFLGQLPGVLPTPHDQGSHEGTPSVLPQFSTGVSYGGTTDASAVPPTSGTDIEATWPLDSDSDGEPAYEGASVFMRLKEGSPSSSLLQTKKTQYPTQYEHWPHVAATRHLGSERDKPHFLGQLPGVLPTPHDQGSHEGTPSVLPQFSTGFSYGGTTDASAVPPTSGTDIEATWPLDSDSDGEPAYEGASVFMRVKEGSPSSSLLQTKKERGHKALSLENSLDRNVRDLYKQYPQLAPQGRGEGGGGAAVYQNIPGPQDQERGGGGEGGGANNTLGSQGRSIRGLSLPSSVDVSELPGPMVDTEDELAVLGEKFPYSGVEDMSFISEIKNVCSVSTGSSLSIYESAPRPLIPNTHQDILDKWKVHDSIEEEVIASASPTDTHTTDQPGTQDPQTGYEEKPVSHHQQSSSHPDTDSLNLSLRQRKRSNAISSSLKNQGNNPKSKVTVSNPSPSSHHGAAKASLSEHREDSTPRDVVAKLSKLTSQDRPSKVVARLSKLTSHKEPPDLENIELHTKKYSSQHVGDLTGSTPEQTTLYTDPHDQSIVNKIALVFDVDDTWECGYCLNLVPTLYVFCDICGKSKEKDSLDFV